MSWHRFFVAAGDVMRNDDGEPVMVTISGAEAEHLARVLRLGPGTDVVVCDNTGWEYLCALQEVTPGRAVARVKASRLSPAEPTGRICLLQGLAKGEKMDWVIQKGTELGVSAVYPVETEWAVVRLSEDKAEGRVRRWERIAREAAKQCGRAKAPDVHPVLPLVTAASEAHAAVLVVPWEGAKEPLSAVLPKLPALAREKRAALGDSACVYDAGLVIGPEGGLSAAEVSRLEAQGALVVSLGPRILRTETAALATLALLLAAWGDFGAGRSLEEWR